MFSIGKNEILNPSQIRAYCSIFGLSKGPDFTFLLQQQPFPGKSGLKFLKIHIKPCAMTAFLNIRSQANRAYRRFPVNSHNFLQAIASEYW